MRIGSEVKIVDSVEVHGDSISHLIGNVYKVVCHWKQKEFREDTLAKKQKRIYVQCEEFGGQISLIAGEYEEIV